MKHIVNEIISCLENEKLWVVMKGRIGGGIEGMGVDVVCRSQESAKKWILKKMATQMDRWLEVEPFVEIFIKKIIMVLMAREEKDQIMEWIEDFALLREDEIGGEENIVEKMCKTEYIKSWWPMFWKLVEDQWSEEFVYQQWGERIWNCDWIDRRWFMRSDGTWNDWCPMIFWVEPNAVRVV